MIRTSPEFGFDLPGYVLLREIGRGGVSTVYLARHELLGREVAIKVISPVLAVEEGFNKRFIREGQTVAQLKHPGIVTVYDVSVADQRPYIAMEYLPGGSLKDRIKSPLPPEEAVAFMRTIADSLGYAHSRGVFHRDVKPENILFRDNGEAVLTDFGIAKSESHDTALTSIGVVVGTPRYISPEQAQGNGGDARSDIYALGVIFHEMLTGRPPYDVQGSMSLLYAHINEPIPRLPEELAGYQSLLDDLLAKDPEQRISDCAVLLSRLEEPNQPVRRRWIRRWRNRPAGQRSAGRRRTTRWPAVAAAIAVPVAAFLLWMQGYLVGSGWGPESGQGFRDMVSRLVENGDVSGERDQSVPRVSEKSMLAGAPEQAPRREETEDPVSELERLEPATPPGGPETLDQPVDTRGLDAQSIYNQAQAVLSGRVGEEHLAAAAELHEQAAARGHAMSQYYLGVAYANGDGVERDVSRALEWLERAAESGVRGAQYNLVLAKIFGPRPDAGSAAQSALMLAKRNYAPVYRILGWMYNTGTGVDSSFSQSVRWNARTMLGEITGKAGSPRWVVRRWQRRLEVELDKLRTTNSSGAGPVGR